MLFLDERIHSLLKDIFSDWQSPCCCFLLFSIFIQKKNCKITKNKSKKKNRLITPAVANNEKYANESSRFSLWKEETSILSAFIPTETQNSSFHHSVSLQLLFFLFNTTFVFVPLDKNIKHTPFIPPSEMPPACKMGRLVGGWEGWGASRGRALLGISLM